MATSGHKILRLNNKSELEYINELDDGLVSGYISDIYEDQHQNLYVNVENEGVFVKRYQSKDYECLLRHDNSITETCLYGSKGIGTIINADKGIFKVGNNTFNVTSLEVGGMGIVKGIFTTIYGKTWIYASNGDIRFFDKKGVLHSYNDPILKDALYNDKIELLYEDRFKNLWVAVKNKGISLLSH